jgi:hypothetical protein
MGQVKNTFTEPFPCHHPKHCLTGAHPDWESHPSWIAGIEALNSYNLWVSEVLMPLAFQWIEEHHDEVYANVAPEHKADVGVVTAAAFELLKELPSYKRWMAAFENYQAAVDAGTWDPTEINPVWTRITKDVRKKTEESFAAEKKHLKDTLR